MTVVPRVKSRTFLRANADVDRLNRTPPSPDRPYQPRTGLVGQREELISSDVPVDFHPGSEFFIPRMLERFIA